MVESESGPGDAIIEARNKRPLNWRALGLPLLLLIAAALRLSNLDWDGGHLYHPDERFILMTTDALRVPWPLDLKVLLGPDSPLNPKAFAYGSLVFYLLKFFHWVVQGVGAALGFSPQSNEWMQPGLGALRFTGRVLSGLVDTGTVWLTYKLGTTLYGRRVGFLAAALFAFSVLGVQLSHFYASDTPMTFFVMLALLASAHVVRWGSRRAMWGAGIATGLALACKVSAAPVLAGVGAAHLIRAVLPSDEALESGAPRRIHVPSADVLARIVIVFGLVVLLALVTMVVFEPYALIDSTRFFANVGEQNAMVRGTADLPYTRQYIDRPAYLYFIQNLALFGVGLPLGLAMLAGWAYVAWRAIREPRRADLLLLAFVVPYFAITGSFHSKFIRYLLPILPCLAIFAAVGLERLRAWATERTKWVTEAPPPLVVDEETQRWAELKGLGLFEDVPVAAPRPIPSWATRGATALTAFVVLWSAFYTLAYQNVYRGEHTAEAASRWIYANVAPRSTIATEHWEEGMPVAIKDANGRQFDAGQLQLKHAELPLYEPDDERKLQILARALAQSDYIVFFSNRLYGTIPRLPDRYPMSTRYYQMLFGEELGFQLVGAFAKYPQFAGVALVDDTLSDPGLPTPQLLKEQKPAPITINLGHADEAFSVYDHPKVLIFKKVRPLTEADVRAMLAPALANAPPQARVSSTAAAPVYRSLLLEPAQKLRQRLGGTYSALFDRNGLANQIPFPVWALTMLAVGLAALPLTLVVFARLGDGGLPLARPLGLLVMTWVTWMVVALAGAPATRVVVLVGFIVLCALSATFARRGLETLRDLWGERRAALLAGELAFWVPFVYFVVVRMLDPDLWHPARGGEKPMDLAYLMAAVKSTTYPPYDPWFAGGFLNYYYFGQIIVGNLVKLTGVVPTTAYNLIVPMLFALTFAGAFSVAYNLARRLPGVTERAAIVGGVAGGLFVTTIGNLGGALQIGDGLVRMAGYSYQSLIPGAQYVVLGVLGFAKWLTGTPYQVGTDWYWTSTRVIPGTINEFPYFTFLYADLHAHMIALPFTLLAMAMALTALFSPPPRVPVGAFSSRLGFALPVAVPRARVHLPTSADEARRAASRAIAALAPPEELLRVVLTGLAVGALLPINSWDFPTYLGVVAVATLAPWYLTDKRDLAALTASVARVALVAVLSYALYLPFHRNFDQFYTGVQPTPERSDLWGYLEIHGFFLALLGSYAIADAAGAFARTGFWRNQRALWRRWDRYPHFFALRARLVHADDGSAGMLLSVALALGALVLIAVALGYFVAGVLVAALLLVVWRMLAVPHPPARAFVLLLLATGLALGAAVEIVALVGDVGRMNTVFKFYLQVWVMWGVASAVALVALRHHLTQGLNGSGLRRWWATAVAVLFLCCCFYPLVATRARVADRFDTSIPPTLDGTAYMESAVYHDNNHDLVLSRDLRAIEWMWDNVEGSPVVAEGQTPLYRWGSRVSIYTGLPTIIGWDWHQTQQRWGFRNQIEDRSRDVRDLFTDPSKDRALQILRQYEVSYVYVGDLERAYYPPSGLAKFDQMVGRELELAYAQDGVKIYHVVGAQ